MEQIEASSEYVDWASRTVAAYIGQWIDGASLRRGMEAELRGMIEGRGLANEAGEAPPLPVGEADYRLRQFDLDDDLSLLACIHFHGQRDEFPFVGVPMQTRDLRPEEVGRVTSRLAQFFGRFSPRWVRFWSPQAGVDLRELPDTVGDQRMLVGRVEELAERNHEMDSALTLEPTSETWAYHAIPDIREQLEPEVPLWGGTASASPQELLEACAEQGTLWRALYEGEYAGLMAVRWGRLRGLEGWEIVLELLAPACRGRGLASSLQRSTVRRLASSGGLIFGAIDEENQPSIRTAQRVGRVDIGGWVLMEVDR